MRICYCDVIPTQFSHQSDSVLCFVLLFPYRPLTEAMCPADSVGVSVYVAARNLDFESVQRYNLNLQVMVSNNLSVVLKLFYPIVCV